MIPINPKLKSLLLAVALPFLSFAGSKTDTTKLNAISRKMFDDGNKNFLLIDAIKDGLLLEKMPYTYEYDNGDISLNGEQLSEPYRSRYAEKMEAFLKKQGSVHSAFSITGSSLSLDKLQKEEQGKKGKNSDREKEEKLNAVITAMAADSLLDESQPINLKWYPNGLYVNNNKLEGELEKKYTALMEDALGQKPRFPGDSYIHRRGAKR